MMIKSQIMMMFTIVLYYFILLVCFNATYTNGKTTSSLLPQQYDENPSSRYYTYPANNNNINYNTQTPWGNHKVSIYHEEIDHNVLITNNITLSNAIIGVISRSILLEQWNHPTRRSSTMTSSSSLKRDLGDFDALNELFKGVVISLPDINELNAGSLLGLDLLIWINNMKCFDISVDDIIIRHEPVGITEYDLSIEIIDLAISCDLDWRYVVLLQ